MDLFLLLFQSFILRFTIQGIQLFFLDMLLELSPLKIKIFIPELRFNFLLHLLMLESLNIIGNLIIIFEQDFSIVLFNSFAFDFLLQIIYLILLNILNE